MEKNTGETMESFSLRYLDISTATAPQQESIPVFFLQITLNKVDSTDSQTTGSSSNPLRIVRGILVKQRKRDRRQRCKMHGAIFGLYFGSRRSSREICTQIGPKKAEWRVDRGGDKGNVMMATSAMQVRRV